MRQRRTALKHVLSWERVQGSVDEPIHNSCSVRDQSRMEPTQPNDPTLVPFEGQRWCSHHLPSALSLFGTV